MIVGEFKIIGDYCYIAINKKGTLERLPKIKWYWQIWFAIKNVFGKLHIEEVREKARK